MLKIVLSQICKEIQTGLQSKIHRGVGLVPLLSWGILGEACKLFRSWLVGEESDADLSRSGLEYFHFFQEQELGDEISLNISGILSHAVTKRG